VKQPTNDAVTKLLQNRFNFVIISLQKFKENLLDALDILKIKTLDVLHETNKNAPVLGRTIRHLSQNFLQRLV
jgi:hypothetical protein